MACPYNTSLSNVSCQIVTSAAHVTVHRYSILISMYNGQDAKLYNILYYIQCSACCGRFLRPSSRVRELYTQHLACVRLACCYR